MGVRGLKLGGKRGQMVLTKTLHHECLSNYLLIRLEGFQSYPQLGTDVVPLLHLLCITTRL